MKRTAGDIVRIELGNGRHCYAQILKSPLIAFFDLTTGDDLAIDQIANLPVAFSICVMDSAIKSGAWHRVGNTQVSSRLSTAPAMFKQDTISGRLSLYDEKLPPTYERAATLSECRGLERAAVWSANHVEDRLRDHFGGIENKWVKSLLIDESKVPADQRF